jgi:NAD-dependent oxidoreductase involved in siderophore biosynthesis
MDIAAKGNGFFRSITGMLARFQKRREAREELAALGSVESDRLAHDVGIAHGDLVALAEKGEDAADLMKRRLAEEGVNIKCIEPVTLRDMQRCCSLCSSKGICEHELDTKPKAAAWPSYCPNESTIAELSARKRH